MRERCTNEAEALVAPRIRQGLRVGGPVGIERVIEMAFKCFGGGNGVLCDGMHSLRGNVMRNYGG